MDVCGVGEGKDGSGAEHNRLKFDSAERLTCRPVVAAATPVVSAPKTT